MEKAPEQLSEQGKQAYQNGNFASAIDYFLKAELLYKNNGDSLQAAEMANNRSVALLQSGDATAALEACKDTHIIFAAAGDSLREGYAFGNQAAALKELGKKSESLKLYKQSAEKLANTDDKENLIIVQKTISALEMETGNKINAMSAMLDALRAKQNLTLREKILRKLFSIVSRLMP
jgi:tetratricopeptide (TPR) repeat protein